MRTESDVDDFNSLIFTGTLHGIHVRFLLKTQVNLWHVRNILTMNHMYTYYLNCSGHNYVNRYIINLPFL